MPELMKSLRENPSQMMSIPRLMVKVIKRIRENLIWERTILPPRVIRQKKANLIWETSIRLNMPKTIRVRVPNTTERNRYGATITPHPKAKIIKWVRESRIKWEIIRLRRHKVTRAIKKTRLALRLTPKWIKTIEVDSNKATKTDRGDLPKTEIVLPKARANLQWKARKIRDHTRWMPG
jgi:hypothetical protein